MLGTRTGRERVLLPNFQEIKHLSCYIFPDGYGYQGIFFLLKLRVTLLSAKKTEN